MFLAGGISKLGGDLGGCPFATCGAEEIADGGELVFEGFGKGELLGRLAIAKISAIALTKSLSSSQNS